MNIRNRATTKGAQRDGDPWLHDAADDQRGRPDAQAGGGAHDAARELGVQERQGRVRGRLRRRPGDHGRNAPEVLENTSVLEPHEEAAHQATMRGDELAYLEALRAYCKAGRDEALRIRRGAA